MTEMFLFSFSSSTGGSMNQGTLCLAKHIRFTEIWHLYAHLALFGDRATPRARLVPITCP